MIDWYRTHSALWQLDGPQGVGFMILGGGTGELLFWLLGFDIGDSGTGDAVLDAAFWLVSRFALGLVFGEIILRGVNLARRR